MDALAEVQSLFGTRRFHGPAGLARYGKYQAAMLPPLHLVWAHARRFRTVLHAGGHLGFLSLALATRFAEVHVFEAAEDNYAWLQANVAHNRRIHAAYGALGDGQPVTLMRHKYSATHHVKPGGTIPCSRIDDLALHDLDVLLLDTEGSEYGILEHGLETIARERPLLVIEEWPRWCKRYGHQAGDLAALLAPLGYQTVGTTAMDIAFAPAEWGQAHAGG